MAPFWNGEGWHLQEWRRMAPFGKKKDGTFWNGDEWNLLERRMALFREEENVTFWKGEGWHLLERRRKAPFRNVDGCHIWAPDENKGPPYSVALS